MWLHNLWTAIYVGVLNFCLTHLSLDKMASILADNIFKRIFLRENDRIPIKI